MVLHSRNAKKPTLQHVGTLMCGYFHCTTVSRSCEAGALLAEACHIMQYLFKQPPEEDSGTDVIGDEIKKRIFWYLFTIDTTEASSGNPIHLMDFEGFPDFPMEVEDELITASGAFPQPADRLSAMTGFVTLLKLFRLMHDCIVRHRQLRRFLAAATAASNGEPVVIPQADAEQSLAWAEDALAQAEEIMNNLPSQLAGEQDISHLAEDEAAVFGMQRANLLITALSLQFVLFEYKLALSPESEHVIKQRENAGRRGIEMLKGISLDDLAANGESMVSVHQYTRLEPADRTSTTARQSLAHPARRARFQRVGVGVVGFGESESAIVELPLIAGLLQYSNIQFVQVVPQNIASIIPSRAASPGVM